jgi:hypothetical protein
VCETFTCLPDEAERQDPQLVRRILQHRNAKYAVELMNGGEQGAERLKSQPALLGLLKEMLDAQGMLDADDPLFAEEEED